jgi:hypothetical protein
MKMLKNKGVLKLNVIDFNLDDFISNEDVREVDLESVCKFLRKNEVSFEDRERIIKHVAYVYTRYPKIVIKLNKKYNDIFEGYKRYIDETCHNLRLLDEEYFLFIDNKKRWCFTSEDVDQVLSTNINPYTGKKMNASEWSYSFQETTYPEIPDDLCTSIDPSASTKITLSEKAHDLLYFWKHEVFTLGNVYFKVPFKIQKELAQTRPCGTFTLYRGMSFPTEENYTAFLKRAGCIYIDNSLASGDMIGKCKFHQPTFASWSWRKEVAQNFATNYFKFGIVMTATFSTRDVLVDLTKISSLHSSEEEVIILPKIYDVTLEHYENINAKFTN